MKADRLAQCEGKQRFVTFHAAQRVARAHRRARGLSSVYHCEWCRAFHIGSPEHSRQKRLADTALREKGKAA